VYRNDASQAQASGDPVVLAVAVQATVAVSHNFVDKRPGRELVAEGEADSHGTAKRRECSSGVAVGKVRARGKGCVKSSQVTSEDLGGARSRAHLLHSSAREHSGRSDDAGR